MRLPLALLVLTALHLTTAAPTPTAGPLDVPDALNTLAALAPNMTPADDPDLFRYGRLGNLPPAPTSYIPTPLASSIAAFTSTWNGFIVNNPKVVKNPKFHPAATATTSSPPPKITVGCFPGSNLRVPSTPATAAILADWWCPSVTEYAFMGFSYDQTPCQSYSQLLTDFKKMRATYGARYVRLYGTCDNAGYNDDLVNAAAGARIGVYALVWFGFNGDDLWITRMAALVTTIQTNPNAPYVIRSIAVGSEPLFDGVLSPNDLVTQINGLRSKLKYYGIQTTISEMPYGFQSNGDAPQVFAAINFVEGNVLPFFDAAATTGGNAWGVVSWSISYFQAHGLGKPIRMTQTGWPSNTNIWPANSASAVASIASEKAYFDLLNAHCSDLKSWGVGWFAQIWDDNQLNGWGVLDQNDQPKFTFAPKTSC